YREGHMQLTLDGKARDRFAKDGFTTLLWLSAPPGDYRMRELVIETNKGRLTSGATGVRIQ
ncbi:MAG TPA: hypothetical protein VIC32_03125, partial [Terriglobales bacterium]